MVGKRIFYENQIFQFTGILIISALVLFSKSSILIALFFFFTLYFFWKSEKDYFWLAYVFIITQDVGGIYYGQTSNIIEIGPLDISYLSMFCIIAFFKKYSSKEKVKIIFNRPLKLYIFYLVFLIYLGFFIYGNTGGGTSGYRYYYSTFLFLIYLSYFYSVPRMLNSNSKIEYFTKFLFVGIVLNVIGQIFHIVYGIPIYAKFGNIDFIYTEANYLQKLVRPVWGHQTILIALGSAMFYFITKNKRFNKNHLLIIISICLLSVFVGATRGWVISMTFLFFSFLLYVNAIKAVRVVFTGSILVFIILSSSSIARIQVSKVLDRLYTLEKLAGGDLTAGGTNVRLTSRSEKVMNVFYDNPVFGAGFSSEAMQKNDTHVGNQNILMVGGLIGFMIIFYFWIYFINKVLIIKRLLSIENKYKSKISFLILILLSTVLIHSSSTSLYGYLTYLKGDKLLIIIILFVILNQFMLSAITYESKITT